MAVIHIITRDALLTYTVPTNKLPLLDWTNIRFSYGTKYDWTGASLLAKSQGNTLENSQTRNFNAELNFEQLYSKSKFLRAVYAASPTVPRQARDSMAKRDTSKIPKIKDTESAGADRNGSEGSFTRMFNTTRIWEAYCRDIWIVQEYWV
ncbi:MAG: hypothetical protein WDO19_23650 [Bacteroidota bacterium]